MRALYGSGHHPDREALVVATDLEQSQSVAPPRPAAQPGSHQARRVDEQRELVRAAEPIEIVDERSARHALHPEADGCFQPLNSLAIVAL